MKSVKTKELKDDAILNIKVNKTFYLMSKAALFNSFTGLHNPDMKPDEFVKSIVSKEYKDMDNTERTFYTLTLLVGEIEKQASETKSFIEKEMSEEELAKALSKSATKSNED
jgi:hypothetical protein